MAPTKPTPPVAPEDKLSKFRFTEDTHAVRYNGQVWRVVKQRTSKIWSTGIEHVLYAISRGSGEREEFLWIAQEACKPIAPKKPKRVPKAKKAAKKRKAPAPVKQAAPAKKAKQAPKKVAKSKTPTKRKVQGKK
jgi:hypothetical protein